MPVTIQDEKSWVLDIITCRTQNRKATAQFSMSRGMFEWIVRECLCGNTLIWKKKIQSKRTVEETIQKPLQKELLRANNAHELSREIARDDSFVGKKPGCWIRMSRHRV